MLGMAGELRQEITMFLSSGGGGREPEHFARIEEVRDSYGTRTTGKATSETGLSRLPVPARGEDKSAGAFAQGLEMGSQVWTERVTPSPIRADVGGEPA